MEIQCVNLGRRIPYKTNIPQKGTRVLKGVGLCIFLCQNYAYAQNWRLTPSVQLQEIYSDNITLASKDKAKSALVTQLNPALNIIWQAGKSSLNLRYNMQNLYNAHGDGDYSLAHQLQLNAHNLLSPNRFFVDSRASVSQQNLSTQRFVSDNISGNKNDTTTVSSFGISPTWLPHFGNYASGTVRVNADVISSGNHNTAANFSGLSDSAIVSENVQLNSGSKFKRVTWSAGFNNSQTYRSGGNDVKFQNSNLTLRTHIDEHFSLFASVGQSDNQFATRTATNQNGLFYTAGVRWSPSTHYWLEAGAGNNSYVSFYLSPIQRLNWLTTFRRNNIGLNSGDTWQTALNYHTRHSRWSLTHVNDTTTLQEILLKPTLVTVDTNQDPLIYQPVQISVNLPTLTDDVLVRESWNLSASFFTGKSSISLNAFNQDRTYQVNKTVEHIRGVNGLWNWQFAPKTSAYLSPQWQQIDRHGAQNIQSHDNRYDIVVGLNQLITKGLTGRLEFRHLTQTSDLSANDYQENRATANLFMRF